MEDCIACSIRTKTISLNQEKLAKMIPLFCRKIIDPFDQNENAII